MHSPLDAMLLSLLNSAPAHGYALISRLREASGGAFDLPEGTIYPALQKLEAEGLIESGWRQVDNRRRRVYAPTAKGRATLDRRVAEWREYLAAVDMVMAR